MIGNNRLSPAATAAAGSLNQLGTALDNAARRQERWRAGLRTADDPLRRMVGETRARQAFLAILDDETEATGNLAAAQGVAGKSSSRMSQGILELSRGFEDFAVAGPRGAINNLSQFALIMGGPVAGAVAGVGGALAIMGLNMLTASENTDTMTESVSKLESEISRLQGSLERGVEFRALRGETDALRAGGGGRSLDDLLGLQEGNRNRIGDLSTQRDSLGVEADSLQAEINRRRQSIRSQLEHPTGIGGALGLTSPDVRQEQEQLRQLEERLVETLDKQLHLRRQIGELQTQQGLIPGLMDEAQLEEARKFQEEFERFQIEDERRRIAIAQGEFSEGEKAARKSLGLDENGQFTGRRSIGNAGPATLQAGSADAFRFINTARAGQINRSVEAKELMEANRKLQALLQELRKQTAQTNNVPEEVVDF